MILSSLLDTDLYKLTMQNFAFNNYPGVEVEYMFSNRTTDIDLRPFADEIRNEIYAMKDLMFNPDEIRFLNRLGFFNGAYLSYLRHFRLNPEEEVDVRTGDDNLEITITGSWCDTILYEVPVLAIVSEVYYKRTSQLDEEAGLRALHKSLSGIKKAPGLKFADFGTRRRYNKSWHKKILKAIIDSPYGVNKNIVGTSNVELAKALGIKPIGTMAHEFIEFFQGVVALQESQKTALNMWVKQYRGNLGIALSDTLGTEAFINDFDLYLAKLYDGLRQDSGDPIDWGEKMLKHYEQLGIDPTQKSLIFSDSLTIAKAVAIHNHFKDRTNVSFGIGTHLTNNIPGIQALNIVIKMTKSNGQPVAKISDSPGKEMCNDTIYLTWLKQVFKIKD